MGIDVSSWSALLQVHGHSHSAVSLGGAHRLLNPGQGAMAREGTCFYPVWPQGRCWRGRATYCSLAPGGGHRQADVRHQNTVQEMRR